MTIPTLKTGAFAHFETVRDGFVPCKVVSIVGGNAGRASSSHKVTLRVTRKNRTCYAKGETIETSALHAIPPGAVHRRQYSTTIGFYTVEPDTVQA